MDGTPSLRFIKSMKCSLEKIHELCCGFIEVNSLKFHELFHFSYELFSEIFSRLYELFDSSAQIL